LISKINLNINNLLLKVQQLFENKHTVELTLRMINVIENESLVLQALLQRDVLIIQACSRLCNVINIYGEAYTT